MARCGANRILAFALSLFRKTPPAGKSNHPPSWPPCAFVHRYSGQWIKRVAHLWRSRPPAFALANTFRALALAFSEVSNRYGIAAMTPLRILHLNSLLKGGGTDDRSVRIARALLDLGHTVWIAGPGGREFSKIAGDLGIPMHSLPEGLLKVPLIFATAKFIRKQKIQIIHARHGRDYWPAILAAKLSRARPKIVLSRHLAKSPSSWPSRHLLLSQCDALLAVSQFVAKVLREGDADPESDNPERHYRPPIKGDYSKIHVVYGGFRKKTFFAAGSTPQRHPWGLETPHYAFAMVGAYGFSRGKGPPEFPPRAPKGRGT